MDLKCAVCGGKDFHERRALLNTPMMTFMNLDFMNESATLRVCADCGFIHWFVPPKKLEQGRCLRCDDPLVPDLDECPRCGWSWRNFGDKRGPRPRD